MHLAAVHSAIDWTDYDSISTHPWSLSWPVAAGYNWLRFGRGLASRHGNSTRLSEGARAVRCIPGAHYYGDDRAEDLMMRLRYFLMEVLVGAVVTGAGFAFGKLVLAPVRFLSP